MKFVMLVGFPGAGKSTIAKEYQKQGYVIHSPDAIRNELNMHEDNQIGEVLDIMHGRMFEDMKQGKNIIYDSTNLSCRRRMKVLRSIKQFNYEKICVILSTPLSICKERNSHRIGYSKVTNEGYNIMQHVYKRPTLDEGWDIIKEE